MCLHLHLGGQPCLSSNKYFRNKQLEYRGWKSGMENSHLLKNTELCPSEFIILPKRWADIPGDFSISNSHLFFHFCLLKFLSNFGDICPNSCIRSYFKKFIWNLKLCLSFPAPPDCRNSPQLTSRAQLLSSPRYCQGPPHFLLKIKVHEINMLGDFKKLAERY